MGGAGKSSAPKRARAAKKAASSLTPMQRQFVDEYLIDLNAKQAAIRAGYSERTAEQQGSRLLLQPAIAAAIRKAQDERSARTAIDADWLLTRLAAEATADIADLYDNKGNLRPVHQWPLVWRQGLVSGVDVEELYEGRGESREHVGRVRKVKLSDRAKRLELIGRHVGVNAFKDQLEHSGTVTVEIVRLG